MSSKLSIYNDNPSEQISNDDENTIPINIEETKSTAVETINRSARRRYIQSGTVPTVTTNELLLNTETYNNLVESVVHRILQLSSPSIGKYIFKDRSHDTKASTDKVQNRLIHGFNISNFNFMNMFEQYYNFIDSPKLPTIYPDLRYRLFETVNSNRNIYSLNQYRAVQEAQFSTLKTITEPIYNAVKYILSFVHTGKLNLRFNNMLQIHRSNCLADDFQNSLTFASYNHHCATLKRMVNTVDFNTGQNDINEPNLIIPIPEDVQKKLLKISKYFNEMKPSLVLNPENGYYSYKVGDNLIPIVCTHEYMALDGRPLDEISNICYEDGKCKFCGQEMSAYHEKYKEALPPVIYALIIKWIETILGEVDADGLNIVLFGIIYDYVLKLREASNDDSTVTALVSLYLLKMHNACDDKVQFNALKWAKFVESLHKYCDSLGWGQQLIDELLSSDKHIPNVKNIPDIVKSYLYISTFGHCDTLPISILFMKVINPTITDIRNTKLFEPKTAMQKIYCLGQAKVDELNTELIKLQLKSWKTVYAADVIKRFTSRPIDQQIEKISLKRQKDGETFFLKICKGFCPAVENTVHAWKSGVCSQCGLKSDASNASDIYVKYQRRINVSSTILPSKKSCGMFEYKSDHGLEAIQKYNPSETFTKYIQLNNHALLDIFKNNISNKTNLNALRIYIEKITHLGIPEDKYTETVVYQCLEYIIDRKLDTNARVCMELKFALLRIKDLKTVLSIYDKRKHSDKDVVTDVQTTNEQI